MSSAPRPARRALLSVSDKAGLVPFARALAAQHCIALISTGTAPPSTPSSMPGSASPRSPRVTNFPEMLDGRVKTLHPAVASAGFWRGGATATTIAPRSPSMASARSICLLVCNLYPFARTAWRRARAREDCVENIDIGGVALIRAAAKNHEFVAVVTDARQYEARARRSWPSGKGEIGDAMRRDLAAKAFALTSPPYDAAISGWMARDAGIAFPERVSFAGRLAEITRYGENPHQAGAFYRSDEHRPGVASARLLQGKDMSYNNYADTDAAFELVAEFAEPAVVIVKHAKPCGVAKGAESSPPPGSGRWLATRSARSAGSSRSTARSTPPPRRRSPRFSSRSSSLPRSTRPRLRCSPARAICGCWSLAGCPIRRDRE